MTASSNTPGQARQDKALLAWQLALLRFAITANDADRLALLAIANELDAPGFHASSRPAFRFFRQASVALCHAIDNPQHPDSAAALQRHLERSEGERLRRVLAAAFAVDFPGASCRRHRLGRTTICGAGCSRRVAASARERPLG